MGSSKSLAMDPTEAKTGTQPDSYTSLFPFPRGRNHTSFSEWVNRQQVFDTHPSIYVNYKY